MVLMYLIILLLAIVTVLLQHKLDKVWYFLKHDQTDLGKSFRKYIGLK